MGIDDNFNNALHLRSLYLLGSLKSKIFVSYYHDGDQYYYNQFSRVFADNYQAITDNSLDTEIESDDPEYTMRRIRDEYLTGTSCTIVLCGPLTRWRKYVDWEIKATLDKQHGLVGIRLPHNPVVNGCNKPDRLQDNIDSGYAIWADWLDLINNPALLTKCIDQAKLRSKLLIKNWREMRRRNG